MAPRTENRNNIPSNKVVSPTKSNPSTISLLFQPGIGLKRWIFIALLGLIFTSLGTGFILQISLSSNLITIGRYLTLVWLPLPIRGLIFLTLGLILITFGIKQFYGMLIRGSLENRQANSLLKDLYQYKTRLRGPNIVAIGGGTGISTLLRGLKEKTNHITAVVTVADDGGSSGRLRQELNIPPPGDARNCLVALSDTEPLMEKLMQYRFSEGKGLQGHNMGNLLLAALTDIEGEFSKGLEAVAKLLGVNGRVLPATLGANVMLNGITEDGNIIKGESKLGNSPSRLKRVWIEPDGLHINPAVVKAIGKADIIVMGPGSLYTSIIPNFLIDGLKEAIDESQAKKLFISNVATQSGETDGYGVEEHFDAFFTHSKIMPTHLIANSNCQALSKQWEQVAIKPIKPRGFQGAFISIDVVDELMRTRHDPYKLATLILKIADLKR